MHVVGLGAACALATKEEDALPSYMATLRDAMQRALVAELGGEDGAGVRVNGPANDADRLPNTLSVGVKGVSASVLLQTLSSSVAASAGAACHTGAAAASISSVLRAMEIPEAYAVGTLRLSVGRHTTTSDVEVGVKRIADAARAQISEIDAMPEGERPAWCVRNVFK
jgi:cysteine desulfurase